MSIQPYRRLPLAGPCNTRDLGGYPCPGGMTRWGAFLRSDGTDKLTPEDIAFLAPYHITDVVDLRSERELEERPSALVGLPGIGYHHVSLSDGMHAVNFEGELPGSMSGLYIAILDDRGEDLVQALRHMANAQGGVLFNCTVGKDRTGVIAMLLLCLAGVPQADVVADYSLSEIYLKEFFESSFPAELRGKMPDYISRSLPASAELVLAHLEKTHGGAESYLLKNGLTQDEIEAIRAKMVQPL